MKRGMVPNAFTRPFNSDEVGKMGSDVMGEKELGKARGARQGSGILALGCGGAWGWGSNAAGTKPCGGRSQGEKASAGPGAKELG